MANITEKDVIIFVRGEQYYDDADPDETELMTEGSMTIAGDGGIVLEYQETELTGMEGTVTRFTVREDLVELERSGKIASTMFFQKGRPHSSLYETPWGAMLVDVTTTSLAHRLTERGGILELRYTVAVDNQLVGENRVKIRVRESKRETL